MAVLLTAGLPEALHAFARGLGMTGQELEDLLNGNLCVMLAAVGRVPTLEEELKTALGEEP